MTLIGIELSLPAENKTKYVYRKCCSSLNLYKDAVATAKSQFHHVCCIMHTLKFCSVLYFQCHPHYLIKSKSRYHLTGIEVVDFKFRFVDIIKFNADAFLQEIKDSLVDL